MEETQTALFAGTSTVRYTVVVHETTSRPVHYILPGIMVPMCRCLLQQNLRLQTSIHPEVVVVPAFNYPCMFIRRRRRGVRQPRSTLPGRTGRIISSMTIQYHSSWVLHNYSYAPQTRLHSPRCMRKSPVQCSVCLHARSVRATEASGEHRGNNRLRPPPLILL